MPVARFSPRGLADDVGALANALGIERFNSDRRFDARLDRAAVMAQAP
jgi:hypothetical protein